MVLYSEIFPLESTEHIKKRKIGAGPHHDGTVESRLNQLMHSLARHVRGRYACQCSVNWATAESFRSDGLDLICTTVEVSPVRIRTSKKSIDITRNINRHNFHVQVYKGLPGVVQEVLCMPGLNHDDSERFFPDLRAMTLQ